MKQLRQVKQQLAELEITEVQEGLEQSPAIRRGQTEIMCENVDTNSPMKDIMQPTEFGNDAIRDLRLNLVQTQNDQSQNSRADAQTAGTQLLNVISSKSKQTANFNQKSVSLNHSRTTSNAPNTSNANNSPMQKQHSQSISKRSSGWSQNLAEKKPSMPVVINKKVSKLIQKREKSAPLTQSSEMNDSVSVGLSATGPPEEICESDSEEDNPNSSHIASPKHQVEETTGKPLEELGGIVVYDSQAKLTGCTKIVDYFNATANNPERRFDPYILFEKDEVKENVAKNGFAEKARERDFNSEYEKKIHLNLPRFQHSRRFDNFRFTQFVPEQQNILIFDSRFENGNLRKAAKVNNVEYNLWLENDTNTRGHTQWYYFKVSYQDIAVRQEKKVHKVKFNIFNLAKTTSLYQVGMKPCIFSKRIFEKDGTTWFRGGEDITYRQNSIPRNYQVKSGERGGDASTRDRSNLYFYNYSSFLVNNNSMGEGVDNYFTFSFSYEFEAHENDEVWFAHAIPSTFTEMNMFLKEYQLHQSFVRTEMLCQSLAKLPVPLLTITENIQTYLSYEEELRIQQKMPGIVRRSLRQKYRSVRKLAKQSLMANGKVKKLLQEAIEAEISQFFEFNEDQLLLSAPEFQGFGGRLQQYVRDHSQKKAIVITARVHPGEPQASHMLTGLLNFLTSEQADNLRKYFVFRIVPMLNPDGVVYGNYRCTLLGCDLNRKWHQANRLLHPELFYTKNFIKNMASERKIQLFCDLHGHSRKQNAFFYGCSYKNYEHEGRLKNAQIRMLPLMSCQKNDLFKIKNSSFKIERAKETTARVVVFKEFSVMMSYTIECSFFGKEIISSNGSTKLQHMTQSDYESLGETIARVLYHFMPSEQHKIQFLSLKILSVFYDEFVKFVPEYILKREEEKMKAAELENKKSNAKKLKQSIVAKSKQLAGEQDVEDENDELFDDDEDIDLREDDMEYSEQISKLAIKFGTQAPVASFEMTPNNSERKKGETSEQATSSTGQEAIGIETEDLKEFEHFIQNLRERTSKKGNESDGSNGDSSSAEETVTKKKSRKKKKEKYANPLSRTEKPRGAIPLEEKKMASFKQPARETSLKREAKILKSKTLALQQKTPEQGHKKKAPQYKYSANVQTLGIGNIGGVIGITASAIQPQKIQAEQQPVQQPAVAAPNPMTSFGGLLSPRKAPWAENSNIVPVLKSKKRVRQESLKQNVSQNTNALNTPFNETDETLSNEPLEQRLQNDSHRMLSDSNTREEDDLRTKTYQAMPRQDDSMTPSFQHINQQVQQPIGGLGGGYNHSTLTSILSLSDVQKRKIQHMIQARQSSQSPIVVTQQQFQPKEQIPSHPRTQQHSEQKQKVPKNNEYHSENQVSLEMKSGQYNLKGAFDQNLNLPAISSVPGGGTRLTSGNIQNLRKSSAMSHVYDPVPEKEKSIDRSLSNSSRQIIDKNNERIDFKLAVKGIILKEQPKKIKRDQITFNLNNVNRRIPEKEPFEMRFFNSDPTQINTESSPPGIQQQLQRKMVAQEERDSILGRSHQKGRSSDMEYDLKSGSKRNRKITSTEYKAFKSSQRVQESDPKMMPTPQLQAQRKLSVMIDTSQQNSDQERTPTQFQKFVPGYQNKSNFPNLQEKPVQANYKIMTRTSHERVHSQQYSSQPQQQQQHVYVPKHEHRRSIQAVEAIMSHAMSHNQPQSQIKQYNYNTTQKAQSGFFGQAHKPGFKNISSDPKTHKVPKGIKLQYQLEDQNSNRNSPEVVGPKKTLNILNEDFLTNQIIQGVSQHRQGDVIHVQGHTQLRRPQPQQDKDVSYEMLMGQKEILTQMQQQTRILSKLQEHLEKKDKQ